MTEASKKKLVIAIDGPAGAGKSTIAARLARELGYTNIETGAMYRALALKAIESDVSVDEEEALLKLAENSRIELEPTLEGNRVLLNSRDVSQRIRERDVTEAASRVSVHPRVRQWMVAHQREMGAAGGVVMEGRDIGTKVFPDADVKVFLDADLEVRGERRYRQQSSSVQPRTNPMAAARDTKTGAVVAEMRERDQRDRTRASSPLAPAADAIVIDSTDLSIDNVLARIREVISRKITN
jgi:CMP/dCMP kinase